MIAPVWEVGDLVVWQHEPRGGYGYTFPVSGRVVAVAGQRICIEVRLRTGEAVRRWVTPARLRHRG